MFSKALFKQSCKANGTMWAIVTFAVCFMLACVMIISGSGNLSGTKNAIQDTIVKQEIESYFEKKAISYYTFSSDSLEKFDEYMCADVFDGLKYLGWLQQEPIRGEDESDADYESRVEHWQSLSPDTTKFNDVGKNFVGMIQSWQRQEPVLEDFNGDTEAYGVAFAAWMAASPANAESLATIAYYDSMRKIQFYVIGKVQEFNASASDGENGKTVPASESEILFLVNSVIYPPVDESTDIGGMLAAYYGKVASCGDAIPEHYDVAGLIRGVSQAIAADEDYAFIYGKERAEYRDERAEALSACFLAVNLTDSENVQVLLNQLASYGVDQAKYDTFGYDYANVKHIAMMGEITYRSRIAYEISEIAKKYTDADGNLTDSEAYENEVREAKEAIVKEISSSLLASLPEKVSQALKEIGELDLYSVIVGTIFYKLAGLLLPIIYMIMAANNLISGQVDSGSMAYVLSTSTKRRTVAFTQAVYLIGSLFAMFCCTTLTSCVCMATLSAEVSLTYGQLILLNVGAFCVLLCLSGLCFLTSCWFDRSKRSMAIGGGLSIFALVASMLGLFGSPVMPSIVRMPTLNYFNYVTVISLFDIGSITGGTFDFIWKFAILGVAGLICYVIGARKFIKKDLPL